MFKDLGFGHTDIYYEGKHVDKYLRVYLPQAPHDSLIDGYGLEPSEQYFRRTPLPKEWKDWKKEEAKGLKIDPEYYHPQIESFKEQEWHRRLNGYWFFNNGVKTYMTGMHYFYCNWWRMDIGYPGFRQTDFEYFYYLQYCIEDPNCLGMIQIAMRRDGKSYKGGVFLYEPTSRTKDAYSGMQSKTDTDAFKLYEKCVLTPFKHLPDFFRPNFDTSAGTSPKKGLSFVNASKRGKAALEDYEEDAELESRIDYKSSVEKAYDGAKLFRYVSDECGKTEGVNVWERHDIVRFCSTLEGGSIIIGKQLHTTTVEEFDRGGENFKKLWAGSDPAQKNENDQTVTGLYRFFTPANTAMYRDEHGFADIDKANDYLDKTIKGYGRDSNAIASFKRKNPRTVEECFYADSNHCAFNAGILNERLSEISAHPRHVPGEFMWKDGVVDGDVVFIPNESSKTWQVTILPDLANQNRVTKMFDNMYQKSLFAPMNDHQYRIGVDPIDHGKAITSSDKLSKAAICVFRQFDPEIDDHTQVDEMGRPLTIYDNFGKPTSSWKTYNFVAQYIYRPDEPTEFYEEVIKACKFFGCKVLVENQKPGLLTHMRNRGYANFLMNRPKETYTETNGKFGTNQETVGSPASKIMTDHWTGLLKSLVTFHGHRLDFPELIKQLLEFRPEKPTDYDNVVAAGQCMCAAKSEVIAPKFEVKVTSYFRTYKRR